ncbi:MAG: DNA polymerase III subunit delta [Thermomonas sp.]|uniref:DNA polymerase III subunit delta n=1 Tax=Thermomonas sp. TaxID=1971895 RepID=UPI00260F1100|nr:DNA polymerase III subunit delta [Thermomonas sp.]MCC7097923.1 DNA polymerase III subunit delta [Thermomonas sp.]
MELNAERLASQLQTESLRTVYLVAGGEPLLVQEACDAVRATARAQGIGEREVHDMEGRDADWDALDASIHAPSLFSSRRLIEVRLPTGKPGQEGAKRIVAFCTAPPPDVVLLVVAGEWSKAHAGKWSDAIAKAGHIVVVWPIKPHELPGWVTQRMRSRGLKATQEAIAQLALRVEGNLLAAAQEIDKLVLLQQGKDEVIDGARMEALVADSARFDVFRLTAAALNGEPAQVSRILAGLRAEGEAIPALMGMVVKELTTIIALSRARNFTEECKALRIWDSRQAVYKRALSRHTPERWQWLLREAGAVDRISKGRVRVGQESHDGWLQLERLLLAVADKGALRLLAA